QPAARFEHISTEQNLSQNTVKSIFQDRRGTLWFGTQDGSNRYAGYTIKHFFHDPENPNSLSSNFIMSICEDNSGDLWIGTMDGLNRLNRETEGFTSYSNDPENSRSINHNIILIVHKDKGGDLWIGTMAGLNRMVKSIDEETGNEVVNFIRFEHEPDNLNSLSHSQITSICNSSSNPNILWIGTADGLDKLILNIDEKTGPESVKFIRYRHDPKDINSLCSNVINIVFEDKSGLLWVGTSIGLNKSVRVDKGGSGDEQIVFNRYTHDPDDNNSLSNSKVYSICEDHEGELWIGTYGGLNRVLKTKDGNADSQDLKFVRFNNEPENRYSLSDDRIYSVYEDRSGVLWIGTFMRGVNKLSSRNEKFKKYIIPSDDPNSLQNSIVRTFHEDNSGILWVGTQGGLNKFDRENNVHKHYNLKSDFPESKNENYVYSILEDNEEKLWLGCSQGGGLISFNKESESYIRYKINPDYPIYNIANTISAAYNDRNSNLWIGTYNGIKKLIPGNKLDTPFELQFFSIYDSSFSTRSNSVQVIYEDKADVFWIGTWIGGLNKFNKDDGSFKHYLNNPDDPNSLSNNRVNGIYEDSMGRFWVSTYGGGLNKFDRENETFAHYTVEDGLPNNVVYGVLEDDNGCLWFGTNQGLCKFDPDEETFTNYDRKDGLQSNEFNWGAHFKSKSGEMFFGGIEGFNAFFPEDIKDDPHLPQIVITDFQIFNRSIPVGKMENGRMILGKNITETNNIELSYKDNVFSFEFAALHYVEPRQNQYAYIMEGLEENWNEVGTRRFATYTHISPGEYIFKVRGSNSDGVWNEESVSLSIIINPPIWATFWFRTLVVMFVCGFIYTAYKIRVSDIERQSEKLKIEVNEREKTEKELVLEHARLEEVMNNERLLAEIASKLNSVKSFEDSINTILQGIAEQFDICKVCVFYNDSENQKAVLLGCGSTDNNHQLEIGHSYEYMNMPSGFKSTLEAGNELIITEMGTLNKEEEDYLSGFSIRSLMAYPAMVEREIIGMVLYVCETPKNLMPDKLELIKTITNIIISAFRRDYHLNARLEAEKKHAEGVQIVEKASRLASIGVMTAGINHEINQPLTAIKFHVDGLLFWNKNNSGVIPETVVESLQDVSQGIRRIEDIIKHMRSFWMSPVNETNIDFDLNAAVENAVSLINRQLSSHGIELDLNLQTEQLPLKGNIVHVEQIIINLTVNAMQSLDKIERSDKRIRITTVQNNSRAVLTVQDNGSGLPEGIGRQIFDPFYTGKKPGEGMGLGLAIVKRFVEEHRGEISAENAKDEGAVFTVIFQLSSVNQVENNANITR
ncbi:MAG: GHKL domain-containing protein, partial [bacterium]|nr:GHKL domain-containing protein [bacterium]